MPWNWQRADWPHFRYHLPFPVKTIELVSIQETI